MLHKIIKYINLFLGHNINWHYVLAISIATIFYVLNNFLNKRNMLSFQRKPNMKFKLYFQGKREQLKYVPSQGHQIHPFDLEATKKRNLVKTK